IAFCGQPRASAIGRHIAMTTGLFTREGFSLALVPTMVVPYLCCHCSLRRMSQTLPAGLQMSGLIVPSIMLCMDWPEPSLGMVCTVIGPSQAVRCCWLKLAMTSFIQACFSVVYARVSVTGVDE